MEFKQQKLFFSVILRCALLRIIKLATTCLFLYSHIGGRGSEEGEGLGRGGRVEGVRVDVNE